MESSLLAHLMAILWDSNKEIHLGPMHTFESEDCCSPHPTFAGSC